MKRRAIKGPTVGEPTPKGHTEPSPKPPKAARRRRSVLADESREVVDPASLVRT